MTLNDVCIAALLVVAALLTTIFGVYVINKAKHQGGVE